MVLSFSADGVIVVKGDGQKKGEWECGEGGGGNLLLILNWGHTYSIYLNIFTEWILMVKL